MKKNFVFLMLLSFVFVLCGIAQSDTTPVANIQANGSDGPIELSAGGTLNLTVSLNAGDHENEWADWWLIQQTPDGLLYYFDVRINSIEPQKAVDRVRKWPVDEHKIPVQSPIDRAVLFATAY